LITNKSLIVASSWSHVYLLFKDARSFEYKDISEILYWNDLRNPDQSFKFYLYETILMAG